MPNDRPDSQCITLYIRRQSQNGVETLILLKELGLPFLLYQIDHIEEIKDEAFCFADIHGHLPILSDRHNDGHRFRLQESGAIVQYLISKYDTEHSLSYPKGSPEDLEVNNWLFFLASRLGPNHDEAVHFSLKASEHVQYGISRFTSQTVQLYMVLERHLQEYKTPYIVDDKFSVADIVHIPYIAGAQKAGIDIKQFPALEAWYNRVIKRPAVSECLDMLEQGTQ